MTAHMSVCEYRFNTAGQVYDVKLNWQQMQFSSISAYHPFYFTVKGLEANNQHTNDNDHMPQTMWLNSSMGTGNPCAICKYNRRKFC